MSTPEVKCPCKKSENYSGQIIQSHNLEFYTAFTLLCFTLLESILCLCIQMSYMILILMSEYMTFNPGLGTIQAYLKRHLTLAGV